MSQKSITVPEMVRFLRAWRDKANQIAESPAVSQEQRAQCRLESKMFSAISAQLYRQGSSHNAKRRSR